MMNVGELKEALAAYGDNVVVMIEKPSGAYANLHDVEDQIIIGAPTVVLISNDL